MTGEEIGGYATGGGALALLAMGLRWLLFTFIPSVHQREDATFSRLEAQGRQFSEGIDKIEERSSKSLGRLAERIEDLNCTVSHCPHNTSGDACPRHADKNTKKGKEGADVRS